MHQRVSVLTFDLDNTLWSTQEAIKICYAAFYAELDRTTAGLGMIFCFLSCCLFR